MSPRGLNARTSLKRGTPADSEYWNYAAFGGIDILSRPREFAMTKPRYTRSLPDGVFQDACDELRRHGFVAQRAPERCEYAHVLAIDKGKPKERLVVYVRCSTQPLAKLHGGFNLMKKGECEPAARRDQQRQDAKPAWLVIWRPEDEPNVCRKFLGYLNALPGEVGEKYRVPIDRSGHVEHALVL